MASDRNKPGTYTQNGVRCTMGAPFKDALGSRQGADGIYGHNKAPFDKAANVGKHDIPTKFFDTSVPSQPAKTVNAGMTGTAGAKVTAPVGQRRFKNPK